MNAKQQIEALKKQIEHKEWSQNLLKHDLSTVKRLDKEIAELSNQIAMLQVSGGKLSLTG